MDLKSIFGEGFLKNPRSPRLIKISDLPPFLGGGLFLLSGGDFLRAGGMKAKNPGFKKVVVLPPLPGMLGPPRLLPILEF